jgi:hypothetical protein
MTAEGKKRKPRAISSELYTTEASESRKQAGDEQSVPDPEPEEGKKTISKFIVEEDDGYTD